MFKTIATDPDTGVEMVQLTDHPTPTDPIYGEQPYGSVDGRRLVVRHRERQGSSLSIIDLETGASRMVLCDPEHVLHPCFHAWGHAVFVPVIKTDRRELIRVDFESMESQTLCDLAGPTQKLSYGTVSQDERWYAAIERDLADDSRSRVWLWDLSSGQGRVLLESEGYFCKHEQFSLDGRNRLLLQCNLSGRQDVKLGVMAVSENPGNTPEMHWLPVSGDHTLPPSGHEAWLPGTDRIVFSTRMDEARNGNLWEVGVTDDAPRVVVHNHSYIGHVAVSRCARYWVGDGYHEPVTPLYMGRLDTPKYRRVLDTHTGFRGAQIDHTHLYLTADTKWIIFGSSRTGCPQVYGARLNDTFLASLAAGGSPRERPQPSLACPSDALSGS